jgi:hypothetical protein
MSDGQLNGSGKRIWGFHWVVAGTWNHDAGDTILQ